MIGLFEHASFQEEAVSIMPNDVLVIYSDGITEAESPEGEEFGEGRLVALVNDHRDAPVNELAQRVLTAVEIYSGGAPQADDMTLLVLKRTS
jgi:sigma-B regulation protein RsbU (phosphoserine phosphatase)